MTNTVAWLVPLEGAIFDLEDMPLWLEGQPWRVTVEDGRFYLSLPASLVGSNYETVHERAREYVDLLNGLGRLFDDSSFRTVSCGAAVTGIDDDGTKQHHVVILRGVEARGKVGVVKIDATGIASEDRRVAFAKPYLEALSASVDAMHVLSLLSKSELSWRDLYVLYEIVQRQAGEEIYAKGWITRMSATRFTQTANSWQTLGTDSRHGKGNAQPPKDPMNHGEARRAILRLVDGWLRELGSQSQ